MAVLAMFLTIDENAPLGVYWADEYGQGIIPLEEFFKESIIDLSPDLANRYAEEFRAFADTLSNYARQENQR